MCSSEVWKYTCICSFCLFTLVFRVFRVLRLYSPRPPYFSLRWKLCEFFITEGEERVDILCIVPTLPFSGVDRWEISLVLHIDNNYELKLP